MTKKQTETEIMEKYEISLSTLRRIIRSQKTITMEYKADNISTYLEWLSSNKIGEFIELFIKENKRPFTSLDIWKKISNELHIVIKPHVIRRILKERFWLNYKKGSSRPSELDTEKQKWLKAIFWLHLIENMDSFRLIINVDGWVLTRTVKQSYSWLEKGKSWRLYNSLYTGSMSLLAAISSDGSSFTAAYPSTVNSAVFISFIESMLEYHAKLSIWDNNEVLIIMDNCPYQTAYQTKDKLRTWGVNILYLPPYWPELAPVELMFRSIKAKLKMVRERECIKYISQEGIHIVSSTLTKIRPKEILSYWSLFYKEIKCCLHFIRNNC